ncbi:MAG: hypothetical protein QG633_118 [Patescibacteria group bacterium]|jgi:gamma-glutamylcyclotransferase (GGCT)/AIG2-like uncharacterized protein YtfP|nr:hypothetical protein [Patescibacteria group bacterium]
MSTIKVRVALGESDNEFVEEAATKGKYPVRFLLKMLIEKYCEEYPGVTPSVSSSVPVAGHMVSLSSDVLNTIDQMSKDSSLPRESVLRAIVENRIDSLQEE